MLRGRVCPVAVVGIALLYADVITLFWLEAAMIALFAVFWVVQTSDRWFDERLPLPPPAQQAVAAGGASLEMEGRPPPVHQP